MSTFLELVNDIERESGTVNSTSRLTDVTAPTGRQQKIVAHCVEAWRMIQASRTDWPWMKVEVTKDLIVGQGRYAASDFAITNFARWDRSNPRATPHSIYDNSIGRGDESDLDWYPFDDYRAMYDRGAQDNGRPVVFSLDPQRRLCVGPAPDKAYKLRATYYRKPQVLAINADEPICPEEHHQTIVWKALTLLHGHDEANFSLTFAQMQYSNCYHALVNDRDDMMED